MASGGDRDRTQLLVVLGFILLVAGAVVPVVWFWHQSQSLPQHEQQVLEAQRSGYRTPAHTFCLGLVQVTDESRRSEAALRREDADDLDAAVSLARQGYDAARFAAPEVVDGSVSSVTAPLEALEKVTDSPSSGLGAPDAVRAALDDLDRAAARARRAAGCAKLLPRRDQDTP